jgi:hypothetical protein
MKKLMLIMSKIKYLIVDEISMMHSWTYALFHAVRCCFPSLRLYLVGDYNQLAPVLDCWSGDYSASTTLYYLCDGNTLNLTHCRRSDRVLFDAYMAVDTVDPARFPVTSQTELHLAFTHKTRICVNEECMQAYSLQSDTRLVPADAENPASQDILLYEGLPLVCWKTKKSKGVAVLANSEIWFVVKYDDETISLQRKLEEVDRDAGRNQEDMSTYELPTEELQVRFRPGYCITVHMSQGKTFRERYTIHDWNFKYMKGRGRYVALSRGTSADLVQIDTGRFHHKRQSAGDDDCIERVSLIECEENPGGEDEAYEDLCDEDEAYEDLCDEYDSSYEDLCDEDEEYMEECM